MSSGRSGQPDYAGTVIGPRVVPATNERRTTVFNDSGIVSGAVPPSNRSAVDYGKFFPRGMRGTLEEIQVYCSGDAVNDLVVSISPQPGMGPTYTATIVPPGAWGWQNAAFNVMWNYDSMYVWISTCDATVFWGYDAEKPYDGHHTPDSGATFTDLAERPFIRVVMTGETAGDVPVSGVINNVRIPSIGAETQSEVAVNVPDGVLTALVRVDGAGTLLEAEVILETAVVPAAGVDYHMLIYTDGALVKQCTNRQLTQSYVATSGRSSIGEFIQSNLLTYMWMRMPIDFRRYIELMVYQTTGGAVDVDGRLRYNGLV